jgi:hypothetical protein
VNPEVNITLNDDDALELRDLANITSLVDLEAGATELTLPITGTISGRA